MRRQRMTGWKEEIVRIKSSIHGLHDAIKKYLELTGNPDRVPVDDLETVCQLTGIFAADIGQDTLVDTLSEFVVYYGFDPVSTNDGFYEKLPSKRKAP
jgi:hypothetical protein